MPYQRKSPWRDLFSYFSSMLLLEEHLSPLHSGPTMLQMHPASCFHVFTDGIAGSRRQSGGEKDIAITG